MAYLPEELKNIIKELTDLFNGIKADYWLGGGLFQCIKGKRWEDIKKNFEQNKKGGGGHDIDFYIKNDDREKIIYNLKNLEDIDYKLNEQRFYFGKIALTKNSQPIDFLYLFSSSVDNRTVNFYGYGKKKFWRALDLPENIRQRYYCYSLPIDVFRNSTINVDYLNIRVPENIYLKILYPKI